MPFERRPAGLLRLAGIVTTALAAAAALSACASLHPAAKPPLAGPAMVLMPLRHANVTDGRAPFRELFCRILRRDGWPADDQCSAWLQRLSDEPLVPPSTNPEQLPPLPRHWDVAVVGGAFSDCVEPLVPLFGEALVALRGAGLDVERVPVLGRAPTARNADIVRAYVEDHARRRPGQRLVLLGYSKGVADAVRALQLHPALSARVGALVSVAGMVNGAAMAEALPNAMQALAARAPLGACVPGSQEFFSDVSRTSQTVALAQAPLPSATRMYSIVALPAPEQVSQAMRPHWEELSRIHPRNDGELFDHDSVLPRSTLLAYANADHLAIALPLDHQAPALARLLRYPAFPRAALIEAAIRTAVAAHGRPPVPPGETQ